MIDGREVDRAALERRVVPCEGVERLLLDERDLAGIRLGRVGTRSQEVAVTLDAPARDAICIVLLLHVLGGFMWDVVFLKGALPTGRAAGHADR